MDNYSNYKIYDDYKTDDGDDLSACCGAPTYGDYMICEDCGEHC